MESSESTYSLHVNLECGQRAHVGGGQVAVEPHALGHGNAVAAHSSPGPPLAEHGAEADAPHDAPNEDLVEHDAGVVVKLAEEHVLDAPAAAAVAGRGGQGSSGPVGRHDGHACRPRRRDRPGAAGADGAPGGQVAGGRWQQKVEEGDGGRGGRVRGGGGGRRSVEEERAGEDEGGELQHVEVGSELMERRRKMSSSLTDAMCICKPCISFHLRNDRPDRPVRHQVRREPGRRLRQVAPAEVPG